MKLSVIAIEVSKGGTANEQIADCLGQLKDYISKASYSLRNIISINFFLSAGNAEAYHDMIRELDNVMPEEIRTGIPVACLAQAPANGARVSAEVFCIPDLHNTVVTAKKLDGYLYLVIQNNRGEKLVIANGIGKNNHVKSITEKAEKVFEVMEGILHQEDLEFSHIFRQWNYIEDITLVEADDRNSQHYQQFNNVRSAFYSRASFSQGYPAATGIGTSAGGVMVSFFAASQVGHQIFSIENPLQKAAFNYTDNVLVGNAEYRGSDKCTPKFSRAKWVESANSIQVFISGTASIREETTVGENDIARQTEITLDNIEELIGKETFTSLGKTVAELPRIEFIRVYIKYPQDYQQVKSICEDRLPGIPGIYVVSDICRKNLLVEIEALASA